MKRQRIGLFVLFVLALLAAGTFLRNGLDYTSGLQRRLPNCLLIGAKKSGTRALLTFLNFHPDIVTAYNEIHYFDQNYDKGIEWYRRQMPLATERQITMEKSPAYFHTPRVPWRVHRMNPSMKLILIVRDPTDRVISDYTQGYLKRVRLNQSVEETREIRTDEFNKQFGKHISISKYHEHLLRWLKWFPRQQIHIVSAESFTEENPFKELSKVERFLGVREFYTQQMFYFNSTKRFYYFQHEKVKECLGETKGREHRTFDPKSIHEMRKMFAEFNQKFYALTGRDFHWPTE
ncbi:hypothetical protein CAPTEDRAFT_103815 [Capitella teleta]|uniref:Sulfotransferase domain-containing protein n=1 Tax=Capitella teleta TaxID=283909 RepID=R7TV56_CAPTE|nr:hypothetical protein CAPTEDRAFT_103815 [Capitella teleta]|eukprot:ELT97467.1 hypothetical protein CAPTEDRAFT_103815 [Capitella teleta]